MTTIEDQWQSYAQAAVPDAASPAQRQFMKRLFYAGAASALGIAFTSEEELHQLTKDLTAIAKQYAAGVAE